MDTKKILQEEINRIRLISNYDSKKTSIENSNQLLEIFGGGSSKVFKTFQELLFADREAFSAFRSDLKLIMKRTKLTNYLGLELKTTDDVIRAIKDGKLSKNSMKSLGKETFLITKNPKIISSIADDFVRSEKFVNEYKKLSNDEILRKLETSPMKLSKTSEQSKAILKAHERALLEDERVLFDEFRSGKQFKTEQEARDFFGSKEYERRSKEFVKNNSRDVKNAQEGKELGTLGEKLAKSGLAIWKGGKWLIGNTLWILLGLTVGYGVCRVFWSEYCKGFGSDDDKKEKEGTREYTPEPDIKDEFGNIYKPCTGTYKINCITKDSKGGLDNISAAQDCLGLPLTGKFDAKLEQKLFNKINKRSFTKDDLEFICMTGGALAEL